MAKFLQLSMNGLNTNWNVLNLVNNPLLENGYNNQIKIGSCLLHTVHGAFQTGATKTGWNINNALKVIFKNFNESPAGCEIYLKERSSSKVPMKFCQTWWIENFFFSSGL